MHGEHLAGKQGMVSTMNTVDQQGVSSLISGALLTNLEEVSEHSMELARLH